jgi:hypothetical protein
MRITIAAPHCQTSLRRWPRPTGLTEMQSFESCRPSQLNAASVRRDPIRWTARNVAIEGAGTRALLRDASVWERMKKGSTYG